MSSTRRLVLILHDLSRTGANVYAHQAVRALADNHSILVVALSGGPMLGDFQKLCRIEAFQHQNREGIRGKALKSIEQRKIKGLIRSFKPDQIIANTVLSIKHVHELKPDGVDTIGLVHEGPVILDEHGSSLGEALSGLSWIVTVSQFAAKGISKSFPQAPIAEVVYAQTSLREPVSLGKPFVIGASGAPTHIKGVFLWLELADTLSQTYGDAVQFRWIGVHADSFETRRIQYEIDKRGLSDKVTLVAAVDDPFDEYAKFDLLTVTSIEETGPLVALECMSMGIPVVYFQSTGGPSELVGDAGVPVDHYSAAAMAKAIGPVIENSESWSELSERSRSRCQEFSFDRFQADLLKALK